MLASAGDGAKAIVSTSREAPTGLDALLNIVPTNIIGAAGSNDILAVMFFALLFGIGLVMVDTPETRTLQSMIGGLFEVMMRLIGLVIRLAPLAIACFMFNLAALFGWELIGRLSAYVGVVLLALSLHMVVVYRSEEHTSELQSLMRISYAVFCLKK